MNTQPSWISLTAGLFAAAALAPLAAAACGSATPPGQTPEASGDAPPEPVPTLQIPETDEIPPPDQPDEQPEAAGGVPAFVQDVWTHLDRTYNSCPNEYDYYPKGGMRIFACHLRSLVSYETLHDSSGFDIFVSGPHTNAALNLKSPNSFGHYNPRFVRWMADHVVPEDRNSALRAATQDHYDQYVRPLARIFFATYQKIQREPACFRREKQRYLAALTRGKVPDMFVERYFFFMNEKFCNRPNDKNYFYRHGFDAGYDGNVTKTCVGFWIRRGIDGTMDEFYRGLEKLLAAYDPELLREASR